MLRRVSNAPLSLRYAEDGAGWHGHAWNHPDDETMTSSVGEVQGPHVMARDGKESRRMKPEQLVCPHCHQSVRDAGALSPPTGCW